MGTLLQIEKGWKPIPTSLKILFGIFILWTLGSIMGLSMRYESGLPFFGVYVYGIIAGLIVILMDIVAPLTFLYALWNQKSWAATFAYTYISIFTLNGVVAFFTYSDQLGLMQILIPTLANLIFLGIIYRARHYFEIESP